MSILHISSFLFFSSLFFIIYLNKTGQVPNLFAFDERCIIIEETRTILKKNNNMNLKDMSESDLWDEFLVRTRANLHVVLAFSPIGSAFRERLRKYPSLINCCTIDWFYSWPAGECDVF